MKAIWNGQVIAESNKTVELEGYFYFPPESINFDYLSSSDTQTQCLWKGIAHYYNLSVNGQTNFDAAWQYTNPKEKAQSVKSYLAFWKGVQITE